MNESSSKECLDLPGSLALAQGVAEQKWPHCMDAQAWVAEWMKVIAERPEIATDEGTMLGWFANAIMAGFDTANMRTSKGISDETDHRDAERYRWLRGSYMQANRLAVMDYFSAPPGEKRFLDLSLDDEVDKGLRGELEPITHEEHERKASRPDWKRIGEIEAYAELLRSKLRYMVRLCDEVHSHWDADNDSKVGKMLAAMAGHLKGYRADITEVHAALARECHQVGGCNSPELCYSAGRCENAPKTPPSQGGIPLDRLQDLAPFAPPKPVCYLRMRDGKPDWAEDCVSEDDHSLRGTYPRDEGYSVIPLYAHSPKQQSEISVDSRSCTCHPADNPPRPCPRKFGLNACRAAHALNNPPR